MFSCYSFSYCLASSYFVVSSYYYYCSFFVFFFLLFLFFFLLLLFSCSVSVYSSSLVFLLFLLSSSVSSCYIFIVRFYRNHFIIRRLDHRCLLSLLAWCRSLARPLSSGPGPSQQIYVFFSVLVFVLISCRAQTIGHRKASTSGLLHRRRFALNQQSVNVNSWRVIMF